MSETRKVFAAIWASLGMHVLLFALIVAWIQFVPGIDLPTLPPPAPLEIVIERTPEPLALARSEPTPPPSRPVIDSAGLQKTEDAPENALFESDVNSRAASQTAPTGDAPLPSQEGRERPAPEFENKEAIVGELDTPPGAASLPQPASESRPEMARLEEPQPTPLPPAPTPAPTPEEPVFKPTPRPEATPARDEGILPRPTPRSAPSPAEKATPTPAPTTTPRPTPRATPEEMALLRPTPRPSRPARPAARPGYQPRTESTKIEGSISNRGAAGADMIGTPIGRYRKVIADAIGSRWHLYVRSRMDLISVGSVRIRFQINPQGGVENLQVLGNTSTSAFAEFSVLSIKEAEIPPLPAEIAPLLEDNRLEIEYTFTIYPN